VIIGFITGSLGVVWPWKRTIFLTGPDGQPLLDSNGDKIISNYERYLPDTGNPENLWALVFIGVGIGILVLLEWYGKNRKRNA